MQERYYFIKQIDNIKFYAPILNVEHKYIAEFIEDNEIVSIHFSYYYSINNSFHIHNIYKNMRNYKAHKFIKSYMENQELVKKLKKIEIEY